MLATIPWDVPATLIGPGQSRSGATFLEAVRAFAVLSDEARAQVELVFDHERLTGSLRHAAIEGYIKHLPA